MYASASRTGMVVASKVWAIVRRHLFCILLLEGFELLASFGIEKAGMRGFVQSGIDEKKARRPNEQLDEVYISMTNMPLQSAPFPDCQYVPKSIWFA